MFSPFRVTSVLTFEPRGLMYESEIEIYGGHCSRYVTKNAYQAKFK